MMRRTALTAAIFLLLTLLLLLAACGEKPNAEAYERVAGLYAAAEARTRGELGFWMEASFRDPETGESGVLYALDGETRYDTASQIAWQRFTATRLGATVTGEDYYENGVKTHIESGQATLLSTEPEVLFGAFPYRMPALPAISELKEAKAEESSDGTLYTLVTATGQKQLLEEIWGLDLYALAGIASPDRGREAYGDVTYTWSAANGDIRTLYVQLTVSLFEKAGYTPGYTGGSDDGRLDLTIQTRITFRGAGESVEIPTYEAAE